MKSKRIYLPTELFTDAVNEKKKFVIDNHLQVGDTVILVENKFRYKTLFLLVSLVTKHNPNKLKVKVTHFETLITTTKEIQINSIEVIN